MKPEMKDKAGTPLGRGDFIVYGHALGRCAGLQFGVVIETYHPKEYYSGEPDTGRVHVRVQGIDSDWPAIAGARKLRPSTLQYGERILIVLDSQVDSKVLPLMREIRQTLMTKERP